MSFDNSSDIAVLVCSPCFNNLQGSRPQAASRSRTVAVAGCRSAGLAAARRSWDARARRSRARAGCARPLVKRRRAKGRGDGRRGGSLRRAAVRPCPSVARGFCPERICDLSRTQDRGNARKCRVQRRRLCGWRRDTLWLWGSILPLRASVSG